MDTIVLDQLPFRLDFDDLRRALRLRPGNSLETDLRRLAEEAQAVARPKALYKIVYVDSRDESQVTLDGVTFKSKVLRANLEEVHRVFAYVVTCGTELDEWARSIEDMLHSFWADAIKEMALRQAQAALLTHLKTTYRLGKTSAMNPGSLADWPIQQQRPLFRLLGSVEQTDGIGFLPAIGVRLTDSFLMIPNKTISGIRFPTESNFESCLLCPRETCPTRRAPYDPHLLEEQYGHD